MQSDFAYRILFQVHPPSHPGYQQFLNQGLLHRSENGWHWIDCKLDPSKRNPILGWKAVKVSSLLIRYVTTVL